MIDEGHAQTLVERADKHLKALGVSDEEIEEFQSQGEWDLGCGGSAKDPAVVALR